jgi:LmbE family N-acetylglucosaminyl deacetylase
VTRRTVLGRASALAAAPPSGTTPLQSQAQAASKAGKKFRIIVTGGHPGDPEYGCGGTVARYTDLGHEVVLLYLNDGEWPPDKLARGVRAKEAQKACDILKARPLYAGQINSRAVVDTAHYDDFQKLLEAEKPNVVFTHWPIDNHADHRAISMLTYGAWLKMRKSFALYGKRGRRLL